MNAPERLLLPDIQSMADHRALAIDQVGVRGLRHPVRVAAPGREPAATIATIEMSVALPAAVKGTHMSRFLEVLQSHQGALGVATLPGLMRLMLNRLDAQRGELSLRFPYFVTKRAPVSNVESLMDYDVCLRAKGSADDIEIALDVTVPVTSLCPCSREISDYGAHHQRSAVTISALLAAPLDAEDL
ncbi:MAG TPA: GTP cyclohydrolase, FolE2/MptA family, partial [Burkholderiales bacterium]